MPVVKSPNLIEATQDTGAFVQLSGVLKRVAIKLSKICNDLRLLSCGPQAGFGEINLPARQAGSSIMPGKVNPVIPEVVNQVAFEVIGNDVTVTMAAEAGQLQLNAFEPIMGWSLFKSITHLAQRLPARCSANCVEGIEANRELLAAPRARIGHAGDRAEPDHRLREGGVDRQDRDCLGRHHRRSGRSAGHPEPGRHGRAAGARTLTQPVRAD